MILGVHDVLIDLFSVLVLVSKSNRVHDSTVNTLYLQEPKQFNDFLLKLCKFCTDKDLSSFTEFLATKNFMLISKTEAEERYYILVLDFQFLQLLRNLIRYALLLSCFQHQDLLQFVFWSIPIFQ